MPMPDLLSLALATALGLLIGLQREWADQHPAGRTFTLITFFGALSGLLSRELGDPPSIRGGLCQTIPLVDLRPFRAL